MQKQADFEIVTEMMLDLHFKEDRKREGERERKRKTKKTEVNKRNLKNKNLSEKYEIKKSVKKFEEC